MTWALFFLSEVHIQFSPYWEAQSLTLDAAIYLQLLCWAVPRVLHVHYIDVILLAIVWSQPSHHLQQPFTHMVPHYWLAVTVMSSCSSPDLGQMSPKLVLLIRRCVFSESRRKLNQQHIWLMDSTWPPSFSEDLLGGVSPIPAEAASHLWHSQALSPDVAVWPVLLHTGRPHCPVFFTSSTRGLLRSSLVCCCQALAPVGCWAKAVELLSY